MISSRQQPRGRVEDLVINIILAQPVPHLPCAARGLASDRSAILPYDDHDDDDDDGTSSPWKQAEVKLAQ